MESNITVSGNIVGELSEKIPSNIIALNELIKNSYDAGAKNIIIKFDSMNKKLIVSDDGVGMDKEDINTLFHIADSKKEYGKINEFGRRTQGSKGLGFLSVFKFGNTVTWRTIKNKGLRFSANYNEIVNSEDVSKYKIQLIEDNEIEKGTKIEIDLNDYNIKSLREYFSQESKYEKILNSFIDENVIIRLNVDGEEIVSKRKKNIREYCLDRQLYYVKYNSNEQKIQFYYNNILILQYDYAFKAKEYELEIELQIFQFKSGGKTAINKLSNKLFSNLEDDLTPLIYINSNLFNNYTIFNPGIMKNKRSGETLNQMIGYIKIFSADKRINFNSDRTQFLQNEVTDGIIDFLSDINKFIQKEGAKYRKHLVNLDFLSCNYIEDDEDEIRFKEKCKELIKDTFKFKDKVIIERKNNKVVYTIFGKRIDISIKSHKKQEKKEHESTRKVNTDRNNKDNNKVSKVIPAKLKLKNDSLRIEIPSEQIDLTSYVDSAINSNGEKIKFEDIQIEVDGKVIKNNILQSINIPCNKKIEYRYLDSNTGIINKCMNINFYEKKSIINSTAKKNELIYIPARENYTITFNYIVGRLIDEINSLGIKGYAEVISCSLRAVFEISIDSLIKCEKFKSLFQGISGLDERAKKVIEYISSNNKYIGYISKNTNIDFNSLKNILNANDFKVAIGKGNLGAHKSDSYISEQEIEHLAKMAAIFVIVINEMITNENIV